MSIPTPNPTATPTAVTTPKKSGCKFSTIAIGCIIGLILLLICCCVSVIGLSVAGPSALLSTLMSDTATNAPMTKWPTSQMDLVTTRINNNIQAGTEFTLTGEELSQIFMSGTTNSENVIKVSIDSQNRTVIDITAVTQSAPKKFLNAHAVVDLEITNGSFTTFKISELKAGTINVGPIFSTQDYATNLNLQMSQPGNQDFTNFIKSFDSLRVENGVFTVKINNTQNQFFNTTN
ncbi:MAG: hypothetical protein WCJ58_06470 [bacterium]